MDWISVKDRLPEENTEVLVYAKDHFGIIGIFTSQRYWTTWKDAVPKYPDGIPEGVSHASIYDTFDIVEKSGIAWLAEIRGEPWWKITHWMPLPLPPKEPS